MIKIAIEPRIVEACPLMRVGLVHARVVNEPTSDALWSEMETAMAHIAAIGDVLAVNQRPAIAGTRALYKHLGKDPNRYRGASEAMCRRIIRGLEFYRHTMLVDLVNIVSLESGYAISGLDGDKIEGGQLSMGVGREGEQYCGIGRGPVNIAGLPVYRDAVGGVASPTTDEERTKMTPETTHTQICINAFAPEMPIEQATRWMAELLERHAHATELEMAIYNPINDTTTTL